MHNQIKLDMQRTITEMEKKLHEKGSNLQKAVCMARGRDEVTKVMAARAEVCFLASPVELPAVSCAQCHLLMLARLVAFGHHCRHGQNTHQLRGQMVDYFDAHCALVTHPAVPANGFQHSGCCSAC